MEVDELDRFEKDVKKLQAKYPSLQVEGYPLLGLTEFCMLFRYALFHQAVFSGKRSNWTYHIALTIKRIGEMMGYIPVFEELGRMDAVLYTRDEDTKKMTESFLAEWEWNYEDIFGKDKELDKLWTGLAARPQGNAILYTYCPENDFDTFFGQILEYWQAQCKKVTKMEPPSLGLIVSCFKPNPKEMEMPDDITCMKYRNVHADVVEVFPDLIYTKPRR